MKCDPVKNIINMSFKKMILLSTEKYNALSVKNRESKYYPSLNINEKNQSSDHPSLLQESYCYAPSNKEEQIGNIGQGLITKNGGIQTETNDDVKTLKDYEKAYVGDKGIEELAIPLILQEKNRKIICKGTKHEQRRSIENKTSKKEDVKKNALFEQRGRKILSNRRKNAISVNQAITKWMKI